MATNGGLSAQVLVVGAGPVGLTLAADLASRGVAVLVLERRARGEAPEPKCNHVSARSMEIFRRLGVARALRDAGLPEDYPNDVSYRTCTAGIEIARIHIPCRRDRYTDKSGPDGWWPTPEPPHRINQRYLEPILFEHAAATTGVRILNRIELVGFVQDDDGIEARCVGVGVDDGRELTVRARYLVGCDGGRSTVRRSIGATLVGDAVVQRVQSTFIRAPGLIALLQAPPAWAMFTLNPRRSGNIYAIDGRELWLVHNYLRDDETDFESVDRDWAIRTILGVGAEFEYEVISKEDWFGRRLVADRFRSGRAFLCGDASHLWVPYAGYGMNAGIADASGLAWLLGAHLAGWAPASILDAYEPERQPITEQVSHFVMNHAHEMAKRRREVPAEIDAPGPEGDAVRARVGRDAYDLNVQQYCCAGLNFGYFLERSPLIEYDGEQAPSYTMGSFTPSTVPGCRVPHLCLEDGRSLYDAIGGDYALLRIRRGDAAPPSAHALVAAAADRGMPLRVIDIDGTIAPEAYRHRLLIARPDWHVAWRGDALPGDCTALVDRLRGCVRGLDAAAGTAGVRDRS